MQPNPPTLVLFSDVRASLFKDRLFPYLCGTQYKPYSFLQDFITKLSDFKKYGVNVTKLVLWSFDKLERFSPDQLLVSLIFVIKARSPIFEWDTLGGTLG